MEMTDELPGVVAVVSQQIDPRRTKVVPQPTRGRLSSKGRRLQSSVPTLPRSWLWRRGKTITCPQVAGRPYRLVSHRGRVTSRAGGAAPPLHLSGGLVACSLWRDSLRVAELADSEDNWPC